VGGYAFRTIVRNRDWKDDITLFTSAVSTYPGSAKMHHAIADVYAEKGYLDEAILGFRHALGIREEAMTYNNLGNAYGLKGAYVPARAAYRKATDIEPEFAEAWMNLGVTALRIGEVEVAAEAFGRAADLKSDDEETQFNLARSLEGMQEFVGAVEAYERALVLRPDWPEALFNLGKVYSELGNSQKALDRYERFLSVWKGDLQFKDAARMRIRDLQDRGRGEAGF
jgi:tetratricopeptide (TPR) repeat protein